MMNTKKYVWAAVLCMAAGLTQAAPASKASVEKLFEVQDFDKMMDDIFDRTSTVILKSEKLNQDLATVPPSKREKIREIVTRYLTEDIQRLNAPELRAQVRNISVESMQKIYTQEEVDAMVNFYGSPIGRSINAKMPQYFQAVMTPLANIMTERMQESNQKYRPNMVREINQVLCGKNVCKQPAKSK
ncbi:DUF2059 domain-containing protein [Neisseria sp. Dent CA1/247]|uniref:DUF2059 domain-containing protein n=1 Tax=Neisseria sp. Dent CA1/247 TaxID=2912675 RepID=UPI001FD4124B|nr:DUF2059 domain-containing protein [Neisseria sp. Dent CA1/247]UOO77625.1 DUF2059 domain-containing protein [Neisseria sp. Dent CA1/247]